MGGWGQWVQGVGCAKDGSAAWGDTAAPIGEIGAQCGQSQERWIGMKPQ